MVCGFKREIVRVAKVTEGAEPSWEEVAARLAFVRELCAVNVRFLRARLDAGAWVVPFLSAEDERHPDAADLMLEKHTPFEVIGAERVDVPTATVEELRVMTELAKGDAAPPVASALAPERSEKPAEAMSPATPESVFDGLVGMDEQKEMLIKLSTAVAKHGRSAVECFHFVFVGNPGTGKTELASR